MSFRPYEKIHRLGKEEVEGILTGTCFVQEKVDGANASIWMKDGRIHKGSRNNDITDREDTFNGFKPYVDAHEGIQKFFVENGERFTLYGEWLVRHSISYKEMAYRKFYLFDIYDKEKKEYLPINQVYVIAEHYGIDIVPLRGTFENPTHEDLKVFIGMSDFGDRGEGIVIKNFGFKNEFGDMPYAKVVTENFKEDNGVIFGGNNKHSETYWEIYIMNKYMTLGRVQKLMHKAESEHGKLDMKHIPMIMGMCYHDLLQEEIWEIQKKVPAIDFKVLKRVCDKKSRQIFIEVLTGDISVAHQTIDA